MNAKFISYEFAKYDQKLALHNLIISINICFSIIFFLNSCTNFTIVICKKEGI